MFRSVNNVFGYIYNNVGTDIIVKANSDSVTEAAEEIVPWSSEAMGAVYAHSLDYKGEGVNIAYLDSGLDIYSEINICGSVDFEDPEYCRGDDLSGHGSAVAGVIAAPENNSGIVGIAPEASIYNLRVLDSENEAPVSRIIDALDWCLSNDIDIINMSFGTDDYSPALWSKINEVYQHGIIMISSAGNGEDMQYPADFPGVLSVSSVDSSMQKVENSASGENLDFVAPGECVYSTSLIGGYCAVSGTSIAAAHITGCAAVLLSRDTTKSSGFIRDLLIYSCKNLGSKFDFGYGIPDLKFALDNYDSFSANYNENNGYTAANISPVDDFSDEDCYVDGQWSKDGHYNLADMFFENSSYNLRFPKFIKIVSYTCDETFPLVPHLHGSGNYIVAAKLLYEIAINYKTEGNNFNHIGYRTDLKNLLTINDNSYYNHLINAITAMFSIFINDDKTRSNHYSSNGVSSVIKPTMNEEPWISETTSNFVSLSQKKATIVYGMCFHLLGDLYAHRSIVPTTAIRIEYSSAHGSSENISGGNDGLYYVQKDFVNDCHEHIASVDNKINEKYQARLSELFNDIKTSTGFYKVGYIYQYIVFMLFGRSSISKSLEPEKVQKQIDVDKKLLVFAQNIPKNISTIIICNTNQNFCYGAVRRLTGLGVFQFKDIKRALKYANSENATLKRTYKSNQAYYEDQAPGNEFYKRRFLVAKAITARFTDHFLRSVKNETVFEFIPYDLISEDYGENINKYTVKIDQYYNYLKDFDPNSSVLKGNTWSNKSHSLFHYTTIIYNGNYFIDPDTYIDGEKPIYYSTVFPQYNLSYIDFYYGGSAW